MKKVIIKKDQRGLLFKDGDYVKYLKPGKYSFNPFLKYTVLYSDVNHLLDTQGRNLNLFIEDEELVKDLIVIDVKNHEVAVHFEDDKLVDILGPGKYAYWNIMKKHEYTLFDIRNPEINGTLDSAVLNDPRIEEHIICLDVPDQTKGILYYDNVVQKVLDPGRYHFLKGPVQLNVRVIDLRQQQLDMTGQEIMTEDKITLRINFVSQYKITDPLKTVAIKDFEDQLYIVMQLILREYIGCLKLDELLVKKQEIGAFVLERLKEKSFEFGIEFVFAGVKDIILPGDIKDILNTVLVAEKKAQANVITRREEVASTRSLLNTARLMEENQTLYRLKELEFLEKICEKIGNVSLTGGGSLLEQLNVLLADRNNKTDAK